MVNSFSATQDRLRTTTNPRLTSRRRERPLTRSRLWTPGHMSPGSTAAPSSSRGCYSRSPGRNSAPWHVCGEEHNGRSSLRAAPLLREVQVMTLKIRLFFFFFDYKNLLMETSRSFRQSTMVLRCLWTALWSVWTVFSKEVSATYLNWGRKRTSRHHKKQKNNTF